MAVFSYMRISDRSIAHAGDRYQYSLFLSIVEALINIDSCVRGILSAVAPCCIGAQCQTG
jgi:hypothetical protein